MRRFAKHCLPAAVLPALALAAAAPCAQENEAFIQADVYDALYDAYARCDEHLDQSRSELITDMKKKRDYVAVRECVLAIL